MKLTEIVIKENSDDEMVEIVYDKVARWTHPNAKIYVDPSDLEVTVNDTVTIDNDSKVGNYLPVTFKEIEGDLRLLNLNRLKNLDGCPEAIGDLDISACSIESLEKGPILCNDLTITNCHKLKSLEFLPKIQGDFKLYYCKSITSLVGIENFLHYENRNSKFACDFATIVEGGLGLLLVKNLKELYINNKHGDYPAAEIIAKYIGQPDKLFECQSELLEAGFDNFAKM